MVPSASSMSMNLWADCSLTPASLATVLRPAMIAPDESMHEYSTSSIPAYFSTFARGNVAITDASSRAFAASSFAHPPVTYPSAIARPCQRGEPSG